MKIRRLFSGRNPEPWIIAVDPARFGSDETVVAIGRGDVLERFQTWKGADTMETTGRIISLIQDLPEPWRPPLQVRFVTETPNPEPPVKVRRLIVDEPGLGGGVIDRLREQTGRDKGFTSVEAFNGGGGAVGPKRERYLNRRAEAFMHLRKRLEKGEVAVPNDRQLFEELTLITWKLTSNGRVQIEAKDDLRKRLGRSTDRADAASLFFCPRAARSEPFAFAL